MPDKTSRSVFVPLLVAVIGVGLAAFLTLVPLSKCISCNGIGVVGTYPPPNWLLEDAICVECEGKGKFPLLNLWSRDSP